MQIATSTLLAEKILCQLSLNDCPLNKLKNVHLPNRKLWLWLTNKTQIQFSIGFLSPGLLIQMDILQKGDLSQPTTFQKGIQNDIFANDDDAGWYDSADDDVDNEEEKLRHE